MSLAQPVLQPALKQPAFGRDTITPFGAMVARQLSVWPFAARTASLFVLLSPAPERSLREGLLRAMQRAYFASDSYSQTRAVREAALAAHYVLRHHNRDVLPLDHVKAASAVAALRGNVAFVALAGQAAAFRWSGGELIGQQGVVRLPRPLGSEQHPPITLWSTQLNASERLILVCGARWHSDSERTLRDVLSSGLPVAETERQLADALGQEQQPAGVLIVDRATAKLRAPHLRVVGAHERPPAAQQRSGLVVLRWLMSLLGVVLLALVTVAVLIAVKPRPAAPQRIDDIRPAMAVRLGAAAANVADLAVGNGALYTLDVAEGAVHAFALGATEQQSTPQTVAARAGMPIDSAGRRLATPVAIEYLPNASNLVIIDQSRTVVSLGQDERMTTSPVVDSEGWQALGALGSDDAGAFYFLDSTARQLLRYSSLDASPSTVADAATEPTLAFQRVAQVMGVGSAAFLRLDNGTLRLIDASGADQPFDVPPVEGRQARIGAMAFDAAGTLFLADGANGRILQMTPSGEVLRQLRSSALAGVRAIGVTPDARQVYCLVASGILLFDIPPM